MPAQHEDSDCAVGEASLACMTRQAAQGMCQLELVCSHNTVRHIAGELRAEVGPGVMCGTCIGQSGGCEALLSSCSIQPTRHCQQCGLISISEMHLDSSKQSSGGLHW